MLLLINKTCKDLLEGGRAVEAEALQAVTSWLHSVRKGITVFAFCILRHFLYNGECKGKAEYVNAK